MTDLYPRFAAWLQNISTVDLLLGISAAVIVVYIIFGEKEDVHL